MTVEKWADIYKATIKEGLRCDDDIAQSAYDGGKDDFDYAEDPQKTAYEDLSCWQE
jgi:hypothetical protein